ncbi:MAG: polysaccharide biosynthesis protein [Desulfovibrionaceae bacterium]|jgi:FlaA1/EpsC-like NDP-sugar epimerase|nr:polysaccharide biosynthesis protein [Desulfovibrionaceae bacterium]
MSAQFKSLNFYLLLALDLGLVVGAHWLAYVTRFEGMAAPPEQIHYFVTYLPYFAALKIGCFFYFDMYRGMWRYTSLPDIINIFKAVTVASLLMVALLLLSHRFGGFSRSVVVLDWFYTLAAASALRVGIRLLYGAGWVRIPFTGGGAVRAAAHRCVLIGAGDAAEHLARDLRENASRGLEIVAVFDDDKAKHGRTLHGLPIVGAIATLPYWMRSEEVKIHAALIAIPSLDGEGMRRIISVCESAGLPTKTIPRLSEIADGSVSLKTLRDVDYKDLLGRDQVQLDMDRIADSLTGKVVLVTGAGGSIGSELCRQILRFAPRKLLLLDASEFNLYSIQMELEHERRFAAYEVLLGNLQDSAWLARELDAHKPQVIFHAAAYKHVPMLEVNPWQAIWNNVLATANLVSMAVERGVERVLVVSTDKAVRPTNVMGATKRLTEKIMQAHCGGPTRLMAVRFGNVVGSAGSVIPLFRRQIEHGGPVTVTHPEVTRFFMTVEEACQLILQAGSMGGRGEIFLLKMGRPVRIADMARDLIRLSGRNPEKDVEIKFIGLRPGEKLYEELITEGEDVVPTEHDKIMVLEGATCSLPDVDALIADLKSAADAMDAAAIRTHLRSAVPEYTPE